MSPFSDFREITGEEPPSTPISAKTYAQFNLPWFDLYDEDQNDVEVSKKLKKVKSVKMIDEAKGFSPQQDDSSVEISADKVKMLNLDSEKIVDGSW